ncbi:MAG: YgeY family selenium metabolism-linked hydrolase [Anaerolineae bacterium]|nr:YgeY family selenium metabolism-linked hydrolase [Anaerolineae bacterium]MEB2287316.1 YgeY family selenium metabolism-linked hydrolase [Anaerolineae bacterium]
MPVKVDSALAESIRTNVANQQDAILSFFREIVAIPSVMGQIRDVGVRVAQEMERLGFEDIRFDRMGNVLGRVGNGPRILLYDSHLDTVDVGDPSAWKWDPFQGKVEDGVFYARGAGDEKQSTPGMIYGMALARDLGFLDGFTLYYFGNMEEDCDGIASNVLVEVEGLRPDFVVIGEPTRMQVYRGHKGRVELKVVAKGRSIHAASNQLGDNAIYKMLPVIAGIRDLNDQLHTDPFLGQGRITVSKIECQTPSLNAVPDECTIYIDRRLTFGESKEQAVAQVQALIPPEHADAIRVEILDYDTPSYTGYQYLVEKYFPAWAIEEEHPLVQAGLAACQLLWNQTSPAGKWDFSTNGIYWNGKAGIPSIGFAAGDEKTAHGNLDQVLLEDVVRATEFYTLLPALLNDEKGT